jgi:hypothetical protein
VVEEERKTFILLKNRQEHGLNILRLSSTIFKSYANGGMVKIIVSKIRLIVRRCSCGGNEMKVLI